MEKPYKISYLPLFQEDLSDIVDYIAVRLRNPSAAEALVDSVEKAILQRSSCAESFESYRSKKDRQYPYDRIHVKNYTVFYVVIGDTMEVRRIFYNRRNMDNLV